MSTQHWHPFGCTQGIGQESFSDKFFVGGGGKDVKDIDCFVEEGSMHTYQNIIYNKRKIIQQKVSAILTIPSKLGRVCRQRVHTFNNYGHQWMSALFSISQTWQQVRHNQATGRRGTLSLRYIGPLICDLPFLFLGRVSTYKYHHLQNHNELHTMTPNMILRALTAYSIRFTLCHGLHKQHN